MRTKCNRDCERCITHTKTCNYSMPSIEVCEGLSVEEKMAYIGFMRGLEVYPHESE